MDVKLLTQSRNLITRRGEVIFPAYLPVTTFGKKYPLDQLIRPYLSRLAQGVMVSYYYAKQMPLELIPKVPIFVDSGGFVSLFKGVKVCTKNRLGVIEISGDSGVEVIHPKEVLELQEMIADVGFTLDFPIPPSMSLKDAKKHQKLTIANAHWAVENRRRRDLPLYACIQAWDAQSARTCAKEYVQCGFEGIAIGGLVPRSRDLELVLAIVEAVREEIGGLPLHVFGLGHPAMVRRLFAVGVDSVDSSSYVKYAVDGKLWSDSQFQLTNPSPTDRLNLALYNLAIATGQTLPLSFTEKMFQFVRDKAKVCN